MSRDQHGISTGGSGSGARGSSRDEREVGRGRDDERVTERISKLDPKKAGKRNNLHGWGKLPLSIHSRILDFVLEDVDVPKVIISKWSSIPQAFMTMRMIIQRNALSTLRLISRGWKGNTDHHPFWMRLVAQIDNTSRSRQVRKDLKDHAVIPSNDRFNSHHHLAHQMLSILCLICRMQFPRLTCHAAGTKYMTPTSLLGPLSICSVQYDAFCSYCFVGNGNTIEQPDGSVALDWDREDTTTLLEPGWDGDVDEEGKLRDERFMFCSDCRARSLRNQVKMRLISSTWRSDVPKGLSMLDHLHIVSDIGSGYIYEGWGRATDRADLLMDELFLIQNTAWKDLRPIASKLQAHEETLRKRYEMLQIEETEKERVARLGLVMQLNGMISFPPEVALADALEMKKMYRKWMNWPSTGFDGDEDEIEDDAEDAEEPNYVGLTRRWFRKLNTGAINRWMRDRVEVGLWLSPTDEIAQIQAGLGHKLPLEIVNYTIHPLEEYLPGTPLEPDYIVERCCINLKKTEHSRLEPFLPRQTLVNSMARAYRDNLVVRLTKPLRQIVDMIEARSATNAEAERWCDRMTVGEIMEYLEREETWVCGGLMAQFAEDIANKNRVKELQKAAKEVKSQKTSKEPSPRIELVSNEPMAVDYGIREVSTSSPYLATSEHDIPDGLDTPNESDEEMEETSQADEVDGSSEEGDDQEKVDTSRNSPQFTALGKRKSPPTEAEQEKGKKSSPKIELELNPEAYMPEPGVNHFMDMNDISNPDSDYGARANGTSETSTATPIVTPHEDPVAVVPDSKPKEAAKTSITAEDDNSSDRTESVTSSPLQTIRSLSSTPEPDEFDLDEKKKEKENAEGKEDEEGEEEEVEIQAPKTIMPLTHIPWIPAVDAIQLGPETGKIIMDLWRDVTERLRVCSCTVCERRREWDAWTEVKRCSKHQIRKMMDEAQKHCRGYKQIVMDRLTK